MSDFDLKIDVDIKHAQRFLNALGEREISRAAAVSINRTLTTVRKEVAQEIKQDVGISASGAKGALRMHRAASYRLDGWIDASGKPVPLIYYGARQTATGVTHKVKGRKSPIPHAFIARVNGHKGVFFRVSPHAIAAAGGSRSSGRTKGRPMTSPENLPIKQLYGPGLPGAFVNERARKAMRESAVKHWGPNFSKELQYRVRRMK